MLSLPLFIKRLSESGATALGPASLVAIAMASRQPGSKVSQSHTYSALNTYCICFVYDVVPIECIALFPGDHLHRWKGQHRPGESGGGGH